MSRCTVDARTHMPFGKWFARRYEEVVFEDPRYAHWLLSRPGLREQRPVVFSALRRALVRRLQQQIEAEARDQAADLIQGG